MLIWGQCQDHMEELRERGRDLPKRYTNPPTVEPELDWFFSAFWRLSPDRSQTSGFDRIIYGAIPFSAIDTYARRYGIEGEAFDHFIAIIKAMDAVFLEIRNSKGVNIADEIQPDDSNYVKVLFGIMEELPPEPPPPPPPEPEPAHGTDTGSNPPAAHTRGAGRRRQSNPREQKSGRSAKRRGGGE